MTGRVYPSCVDIQRIHISTNNGPSWLSWHIIKPAFQTLITTLRSSSLSSSPLFKSTPPSTNAYRFCSSIPIISSILTLTKLDLRIQLLTNLTGDSQLPQMRVAAVGLVKEAIIDSLSSTEPNLFASPLFLRVFGSILFRPSPMDLFSGSKELSLRTFQESSEPQRLVQCLALPCVLVKRDLRNMVR